VVTIAVSLADAHRICRDNRFDLFICDISLPDGEGWELAQLAGRCGARAIALTGYGMPADVTHSKAAGFDAHITKPVLFDQLEAAIQRLSPDEPDLRDKTA
jgi:CheY-like chemotaxis protein